MLTMNITVAVDKLEEVAKRLKKLNTKREKKLGMTPVTMQEGTPFIENRTDPNDPTTQVPVELVELRFTCQPVHVGGWEFVCMLERVKADSEYNLIMWTKSAGMEKYRNKEIRCDHCGQNRKRKYAAILEDDEGNELMVGSTCLTDFLGHTAAQAVASMRDLANFEKALKSDGSLQWGEPMYPLEDAVNAAVRVILNEREYVSTARARGQGIAASYMLVHDAMNDLHNRWPETQETQDKTPLVLQHLRDTHADAKAKGIKNASVGDFEYKVFLMVEMGHVKTEAKWLSILSGAVSYALRKCNAGNKRTTLPGFWSSVGQTERGMFKPVKVIPCNGFYGPSWLVIGTIDNFKAIWFATSKSAMEKVVNNGNGQMRTSPVKVSAMVKEHKQGKYGAETVVKRLRPSL